MESRPDPGGVALADEAMQRAAGSYALQAAIAAAHFRAEHAKDMDWQQIVRLYVLERLQPSPIVSLNRAVAVAMADGPKRGLRIVDGLVEEGTPDGTICFTPPARSFCAG
jgi:RNA polymerase sigma-70 factor (ECF subfamily)